jgi:hypothetical protein
MAPFIMLISFIILAQLTPSTHGTMDPEQWENVQSMDKLMTEMNTVFHLSEDM